MNLRFNRTNIPSHWKEWMEKEVQHYRQILKTVITHKFTNFDKQSKNYIDELCGALKPVVHN